MKVLRSLHQIEWAIESSSKVYACLSHRIHKDMTLNVKKKMKINKMNHESFPSHLKGKFYFYCNYVGNIKF